MGTTLTGTTPQDTYDSLIKVTDNGPLSGTLKKLTDGLGNDSSLSLSTTAASLSGTLAVTSDVKLGTATTGTPSANADDLVIDKGAAESGITIMSTAAATLRFGDAANTSIGSIEYDHSGDYMRFNTSGSEKVRITSAGQVAIGTSSPASFSDGFVSLQVKSAANNISANGGSYLEITQNANFDSAWKYVGAAAASRYEQGVGGHYFFTAPSGSVGGAVTFTERVRIDADGLKFNGDTAAANALDDYEEGTWTPVFEGVTFTGTITATYTKIGRQVTVQLSFVNQTFSSPDATQPRIAGLPFTSSNVYQAGSITYADFLTTDASLYVQNSNTRIYFQQGTGTAGAAYNVGTTNRSAMITATYFV